MPPQRRASSTCVSDGSERRDTPSSSSFTCDDTLSEFDYGASEEQRLQKTYQQLIDLAEEPALDAAALPVEDVASGLTELGLPPKSRHELEVFASFLQHACSGVTPSLEAFLREVRGASSPRPPSGEGGTVAAARRPSGTAQFLGCSGQVLRNSTSLCESGPPSLPPAAAAAEAACRASAAAATAVALARQSSHDWLASPSPGRCGFSPPTPARAPPAPERLPAAAEGAGPPWLASRELLALAAFVSRVPQGGEPLPELHGVLSEALAQVSSLMPLVPEGPLHQVVHALGMSIARAVGLVVRGSEQLEGLVNAAGRQEEDVARHEARAKRLREESRCFEVDARQSAELARRLEEQAKRSRLELQQQQDETRKLESDVRGLQASIRQLEENLRSSHAEVLESVAAAERAARDAAEQREAAASREESCRRLESDVRGLEGELRAREAEVQHFESSLGRLQEELQRRDGAEAVAPRLAAELAAQRASAERWEAEAKDHEAGAAKLLEDLRAASDALREQQASLEQVQGQEVWARQLEHQLRATGEALQQRHAASEQALEQTEAKVRTLEDELQAARASLRRQHTALEQEESRRHAAEASVARAEQAERLEAFCQALQGTMEERELVHEQRLEQLAAAHLLRTLQRRTRRRRCSPGALAGLAASARAGQGAGGVRV